MDGVPPWPCRVVMCVGVERNVPVEWVGGFGVVYWFCVKGENGKKVRRHGGRLSGLEMLRSCLCPVLCPGTSPAPVAPGRKPREVDAAVRPGVHLSSGVRTRNLVLNFQYICQMSYRRSEKLDPPPHAQPRSPPTPLAQEKHDANKLVHAQRFLFFLFTKRLNLEHIDDGSSLSRHFKINPSERSVISLVH